MSYKKLGQFIQPINNRNKDLKVERLLGVSIRKILMPSIANTVGTNMKTYKIIKKHQFAYGPVTSRNGDKISIALLEEYDEAIVSQAYTVFEIVDSEILDPEYLMMWFRRSEFDRYARFKSHGSARETFDWDELCKIELPILSIEKQQEIVKEYNTVVNRIQLNETLNQKLEETGQALYKHWFVDFEFPNAEDKPYKSSGSEMVYNDELDMEIPFGFQLKPINYFSEIGSSKRVFQSEYKDKGTPFYRGKEISIKKSGKPIEDILFISNERYLDLKTKYGKPDEGDILLTAVGTIGASYFVEDEEFYFKDGNVIWFKKFTEDYHNIFIYAFMQSDNFNEIIDDITIGSTQSAITINSLGSQLILKPTEKLIRQFSILYSKFHKKISLKNKQNIELYYLKNLLLSKMTKIDIENEM